MRFESDRTGHDRELTGRGEFLKELMALNAIGRERSDSLRDPCNRP